MKVVRLASVLALVVSASVDAQEVQQHRRTVWWIPGAFTGGLIGAGAGYIVDVTAWASRDDLSGPTLLFTPAGLVTGALLGGMGGASADRRLARGDTLSKGSRKALRLATFFAPVAIGSAIAFAVINPPEDEFNPNYQSPALSDGTVALLGIGGGLVVGFWAQSHFAPALWPARRVSLSPSPGGVALSLRFHW
jgi:hypothetical protein